MIDSSLTNEKLINALYRFSTTVQDENGKLQKCYTREVLVSQLQFRKETTKFQLLCKNYTFKDPHITAFIRKTAYVFDVLLLTIDYDGRIVNIENTKQLHIRWERLKAVLKKKHGGSDFENYLQHIDLTIYDNEKLFDFLESDKMYGVFFKGLWMCDKIDDLSLQYIVQKNKEVLKLTERTNQNTQGQQYIFHNHVLHECIKINDHLQFEILCLGLEK